jgi:hypothetical protein
MRLWSIHPKYLDAKGLVACWREGLLARKVLLGQTKGYRNHPQLDRFKKTDDPVVFLYTYLRGIVDEAEMRGYAFNAGKIGPRFTAEKLKVTTGQIGYELEWLKTKLTVRDPDGIEKMPDVPAAHPSFIIVPGEIESWERASPLRS